MNQSMELDIIHGFDSAKKPHLIWTLNEIAATAKEKVLKSKDYMDREKAAATYELAFGLLLLFGDTEYPKEKIWYCARCGHIDPEDVTNDEKCALCGGNLPF